MDKGLFLDQSKDVYCELRFVKSWLRERLEEGLNSSAVRGYRGALTFGLQRVVVTSIVGSVMSIRQQDPDGCPSSQIPNSLQRNTKQTGISTRPGSLWTEMEIQITHTIRHKNAVDNCYKRKPR